MCVQQALISRLLLVGDHGVMGLRSGPADGVQMAVPWISVLWVFAQLLELEQGCGCSQSCSLLQRVLLAGRMACTCGAGVGVCQLALA
jgi:hypothetical protein